MARVEEKLLSEQNDWLSSFVGTWNEVNSYIPLKSTITASLPLVAMASEKPSVREKDFILATSFDCVLVRGEPHLCLIICYDNGFQV